MFVNLVDKKNEQGALGEAFGAALEAVQDGAGAEDVVVPDEAGDASASLSKGAGGGSGRSTSKAAGAGAAAAVAAAEKGVGTHAGAVPELGGSLRHVWFDFHHEVCAGVACGVVTLRQQGQERRDAFLECFCCCRHALFLFPSSSCSVICWLAASRPLCYNEPPRSRYIGRGARLRR